MSPLLFFNPAGFYTAGTDPDPLGLAVLHGPDPLKIWIPPFLGLIMGMAHIISHHGFLATYFTYFRHCSSPNPKYKNL